MSSSSDGWNLKPGGSWEIDLGSFPIGINDEETKGTKTQRYYLLLSCNHKSTLTRPLYGISCR